MATVCFVNPKGGVGKTTTALIFAEYCVQKDLNVSILDLDPNANLVLFGTTRATNNITTPFTIYSRPSDIDDVIDLIEKIESQTDVLIIDLEGSRDKIATLALSQSSLAVIPLNGSSMEARQAAAAIKLIRSTEKMINRKIAHNCLFTRVNAGIAWNDEKQVRQELSDNGLNVFNARLEMRSPYTQMFKDNLLLSELYEKASTHDGDKTAQKYLSAQQNAHKVSNEILSALLEAVK